MNSKIVKAHLALLAAVVFWGLMAPIGKSAMAAGISGISLAAMRMIGAAVCFWIASLFAVKEKVDPRDYKRLFFAGLLSILFNQGLYTYGLSLTSPIDASIVTTSLPIITMILAAFFLKEPITPMKILGIVLGAGGALMLILNNRPGSSGDGSILGDILCLVAQCSFACYLTIFKDLITKYNVFTLMKWMFTFATCCFLPFSWQELKTVTSQSFPTIVWVEIGFVVFFGTFLAYILVLIGQKTLRPTIVSMYNYIQPIVAATVSVLAGLATFGWSKAFASILIFVGVYVVTKSKSRAQVLAEKDNSKSV